MKYSRTFVPTVKEVPADAEVVSHQWMIRAGFMRRVASGTYTYLPLGQRSLAKVIAIVREEMDGPDQALDRAVRTALEQVRALKTELQV